MMSDQTLIKQGAEARLYSCNYLTKPTIIKERFVKTYRHPDLDALLTKERMKNEARTIARCQNLGIKTPCLYLVDFERRRIYMEHFTDSITVKDYIINVAKTLTKHRDIGSNLSNNLTVGPTESVLTKQEKNGGFLQNLESEEFQLNINNLANLSREIGKIIRKMHNNNIIHGDLTTSNILIVCNDIVFIDFGLAKCDSTSEDKGVDLYVLERALISTHNDIPCLFDWILEGYKQGKGNVTDILDKFEEVRARGRKRTMVG